MLLEVQNLSVHYPDFSLHPLNFSMEKGEILTIIGESGSGKSTIARAVFCLTAPQYPVRGRILLHGKDVLSMKESERRGLRMNTFSIALQNSISLLNPSLTLSAHLKEVLRTGYKGAALHERMVVLMQYVGLCQGDLNSYPHELSGGMVQKFLLANALALDPDLVILDEPTSALDLQSKEEFSTLIATLNEKLGTAFLIITHDMKLAQDLSHRILVLYAGHVVESGSTEILLQNPRHPYTRGLIQASVRLNPMRDVWGIRAPTHRGQHHHHGCPFYGRCTQSISPCALDAPHLHKGADGREIACHRGGIITLMMGKNLGHSFGKKSILRNINLELFSGEIVSIVGPSGAGKTTLGRLLGGFLPNYHSGTLEFLSKTADFSILHGQQHSLQMVFQDSETAINPNFTVHHAVSEPLRLCRLPYGDAVPKYLKQVGLPYEDDFLYKKIHSLSGGQKQRIALARALSMEPKLLIADEPTAMLDPSSKANLLRLLKGLQNSNGFSMLLITHDLGSALKISDRIFLLRDGGLELVQPSQYFSTNFNRIFERKQQHE